MTASRRPDADRPLVIAILDDYQGVALDSAPWAELGAEVRVLREHLPDEEALVTALQDADVAVVMRERTAFPASVLERLPRLGLLTTMGARNVALDVETARRLGIAVAGFVQNSPATAELSWALIMAVARDVTGNDADVRAGVWQARIGTDLAGATLGLLGLGRLGSRMAEYAQVFGMRVLAWSENLTDERAAAAGAERVATKEELFERSDIASVHLVLSHRTRGLVTYGDLVRLGPEGRLVNTSRGPIVVEADLVRALEEGVIRAAALDVFDREPLPADDPLRRAPNLLLSPHIGYVTTQALRGGYTGMLEQIRRWRDGEPITPVE
jgi:phosphoglycerate dehydrogenase-like enzyme